MKKTLILLFVAALGAGTMSSCKKTNKGKMTGDWTVSSYTSSGTRTQGSSTTSWSDSNNGTTLTESDTDANGNTTKTDSPESITLSILKDGTYSKVKTTVSTSTVEFVPGVVLQNVTTTTVANSSGTWSFLKKNKAADLKTNERVIFNETASDNTSTSVSVTTSEGDLLGLTDGTVVSTSSSSDNANDLDNSMIYIVSESKKKELTFTMSGSNTYNNNNDTSTTADDAVTTTDEFTMTLTQP